MNSDYEQKQQGLLFFVISEPNMSSDYWPNSAILHR